MKRLYWRPQKTSRRVILLIAGFSLVGLAIVEAYPTTRRRPLYETRLAAAQLADRAMQALKDERLRRGYPIDRQLDPAESGLVGAAATPVTSVPGHLAAKQTTLNPNFAAVVVDMLDRAGVRPGDHVAVGCSGSFPALNVAVYAAIETMQLKPVVIASVSSSQFGANLPGFLWPDMERLLHEQGLASFRSSAASMGGYEDRAMHTSQEGRELVLAAIQRNDLQRLGAASLTEAIDQRMELYGAQSRAARYKAYINVGGGAVSVGRSVGKKRYRPGLNLDAPHTATEIDSVMTRFMIHGTPVIHLVNIRELAESYDLPVAPRTTPEVGLGALYVRHVYNLWLTSGLLVGILLILRAFVLTDWGYRMGHFFRRDAPDDGNADDDPGTAPALMV